MIFLSTSGFKNNYSQIDICKKYFKFGIKNIELSGGKYDKNILNNLKKEKNKITYSFHNYFPVPKKSFVINLASDNKKIVNLSLKHIFNSLEKSIEFNSKFYSFHAGFLFDPKPIKLGKKLSNVKLLDKDYSKNIFIKNLKIISKKAYELGIEVLIENNVLSHQNKKIFHTNPFHMVDANDCIDIMNKTPGNINMLVDLGHLKVSSNSLNFNKYKFLSKCKKWTRGYHLSDNNGYSDLNKPINKNSWFWGHIKKRNILFYTLETKHTSFKLKVDQFKLLKNYLNS